MVKHLKDYTRDILDKIILHHPIAYLHTTGGAFLIIYERVK